MEEQTWYIWLFLHPNILNVYILNVLFVKSILLIPESHKYMNTK